MKIIDRITEKLTRKRQNYKAKRKEKLLIKTDDDELIAKSLLAEEDNSAINIHKVVETMENPDSMAEVVKNNLDEIIEQDQVRHTLKRLEDEAVLNILEERAEELKEQGKMAFAIQAIDDNDKKLEAIKRNLEHLTPLETATVLQSVEEKNVNRIENQKIKTASEQILRMLVEYGHISQLDIHEMAFSLEKEASKLLIIKLCLAKVCSYDQIKKKNITTKAKNKMVCDLLRVTNIKTSEKYKFLIDLLQNELLTQEDCENIMQELKEEKQRKANEEKERNSRM